MILTARTSVSQRNAEIEKNAEFEYKKHIEELKT
jgi:hypothetical protein